MLLAGSMPPAMPLKMSLETLNLSKNSCVVMAELTIDSLHQDGAPQSMGLWHWAPHFSRVLPAALLPVSLAPPCPPPHPLVVTATVLPLSFPMKNARPE